MRLGLLWSPDRPTAKHTLNTHSLDNNPTQHNTHNTHNPHNIHNPHHQTTQHTYKKQHNNTTDRVFGILREKNPELTGERRRTVLKPPQVAREGTKKTVFTNFMDLCKAMNRNNEHVSAFLLSELGTSGSLDGQQRLVVKGRFLPKSFETVLRRYVNEYVLCPGCKSVDTLLDRDGTTRLMYLRCQQCGASRSVAAIKSGFVARVTKRAH